MERIICKHSESEAKIVNLFSELGFKTESLDSFDDTEILKGSYMALFECRLYLESGFNMKEKYPEVKLVLCAEFSESYMIMKAKEAGCDEFIVTPFGKKEAQYLLKKLEKIA